MRHDEEPGPAYDRRVLRPSKPAWILLGICGVLLVTASLAVAQSGDDYDLSWWTADSGGGTWSTGGGYTLGGTAGQPDAGLLAGGAFSLGGGFWRGGEMSASAHEIYLPVMLRRFR